MFLSPNLDKSDIVITFQIARFVQAKRDSESRIIN